MVEHVEERILRARAEQILNIIDNKDIDLHVECQEVGKLVPDIDSIHVLSLELVSSHVENYLVWIFLFNGDTDGLRQVRLAESRGAEKEKRIEWGIPG